MLLDLPKFCPSLFIGPALNNISDLDKAHLCHYANNKYEPLHDKTNKMTCALSEDSDQPGLCPVWSESSLGTQWVPKDPGFLHADSEDSDQTGRMPRLIWVFAGRTCHYVGFCHEAAQLCISTSICIRIQPAASIRCLIPPGVNRYTCTCSRCIA